MPHRLWPPLSLPAQQLIFEAHVLGEVAQPAFDRFAVEIGILVAQVEVDAVAMPFQMGNGERAFDAARQALGQACLLYTSPSPRD